MAPISSPSLLRKQIAGCWLGKAIGGTLGAPFEGVPGPLELSFYEPVPTEALPNDDLDLQVVWLHHLRTNQHRIVTPEILTEAWARHVMFPFDEYAISRRNRELGLSGPALGATDNYFGECMGGAIRSEIWACVAPGDPARAAGFAWADAVVDHCGEGVWAEVFNAALQSAAFVESRPQRLIEIGLEFIPADTKLSRAIRDTCEWWADSGDWRAVRSRVVSEHGSGNFTHVVFNLCFQLIGWFDGAGDFGRTICTAVNCGMDTDCTGATIGALLGILNPDGIPEEWSRPIGEKVVLSKEIIDVPTPRDLDELTDWTLEVSALLVGFSPTIPPVPAHLPASRAAPGRCWPATRCPAPSSFTPFSPQAPQFADLPLVTEHTFFGSWSQWSAEQLTPHGMLFEIPFEVPSSRALKVMVFGQAGASVWLDGTLLHIVDGEKLVADPMAAPSFHRAGEAAVVVPVLAAGAHKLAIYLPPVKAPRLIDLVWGFSDPETNLCATDVLPVVSV